ncbi:MAG: hypothetical protein M3458_10110 [Acidobacteriota bacterium]|nr:hypothetical protein [Acidobacteriota bacterium]
MHEVFVLERDITRKLEALSGKICMTDRTLHGEERHADANRRPKPRVIKR